MQNFITSKYIVRKYTENSLLKSYTPSLILLKLNLYFIFAFSFFNWD